MRIALVAPFGLRAKGTARARALPLGRVLARRGHQVALFVPPYDGPEDSGLTWNDGGVEIANACLPGLAPAHPLYHFILAWRLLRLVRLWRPDVVHVFKPKGPSGLVGTAWWVQRGGGGHAPLVIDTDDWEGAGGWNDDPRAGYSSSQRKFFAWQESYGLSHAHAWTAASACLRARALEFGAEAGRIFILPNGAESSALRASAPPRRTLPERPTALLYTRFAGVRVDDIVAIWQRVADALPDATLTVVGRGLAGEESELARRAPGVVVRGWVEPGEMAEVFGGMQVGLVPWADTPANRARNSAKVLELMSAALPIVAYRVGELPVTLGDTAVLAPPGDVAAFAEGVIALLNDTGRAGCLGAAALARLLAQFTWDQLAETALEAYRAAIAAKP